MHSSQLVYTWNVFEKPFPWQTLRLLKILEWFKKPVWITAVISYPSLTFFFSHFIRDHEIEHLKTYFYKDSLISEILPIPYWKTIRFYILFCILHKINQLCPKMLRARRDRLRGEKHSWRPFYILLCVTVFHSAHISFAWNQESELLLEKIFKNLWIYWGQHPCEKQRSFILTVGIRTNDFWGVIFQKQR